MNVSCLSEQTPQEHEGGKCTNEPTPLMPLLICTLTVCIAMAFVQANWANPLFWGTVLIAAVAILRNRAEKAENIAAREALACRQTLRGPAHPGDGSPEPPFQEPARVGDRFKGDELWGLN